jgi:alpha-beta hydrolase superfamily lysophospholipase
MTTSTVTTDDGLALNVHEWAPPGAPRGTVFIVHGLGEHAGRHEHVAQALVAQGWRVRAHDQRGHGRSGGARGRLAQGDDLLRDLARVLDADRAANAGPRVLLGHSMGGTVSARFVAEGLAPAPAGWYRPVDALVLSSPALAADLSGPQKLLLAVAGRLAPWLQAPNGLPVDALSHDARVVAAYEADPLVHDRISPRLARFILDAGHQVRAEAPWWRVPTLLLWAGSDRCVAPRGSAEFAAAAPAAMVRARCYEALFHEIFNEPQQREVLDEVQRWLAGVAPQRQ